MTLAVPASVFVPTEHPQEKLEGAGEAERSHHRSHSLYLPRPTGQVPEFRRLAGEVLRSLE